MRGDCAHIVTDKVHLHQCISDEFRDRRNATESFIKFLFSFFDRTCRRYFAKFEIGDFDRSHKPRSVRSSIIEVYTMKVILEQYPFFDNIGD